MGEQQNVDLVRQGYEAFGRGDLEGLLNTLDENIEWVSPGPSDLPTAGTRRGRQQIADFFRAVNELFEIQRFEPKTFVAQDDRVVVLGEDTARVKATGKVLNESWAHAFVVRNGKVVSFQEYIDTAATVAEIRAAAART
jgi:ketosteroid isomerase-like protein